MGFAFIVCGKDILCCDNHHQALGLNAQSTDLRRELLLRREGGKLVVLPRL